MVFSPSHRWCFPPSKLPKCRYSSCSPPLCLDGVPRLRSFQSIAIYRDPPLAPVVFRRYISCAAHAQVVFPTFGIAKVPLSIMFFSSVQVVFPTNGFPNRRSTTCSMSSRYSSRHQNGCSTCLPRQALCCSAGPLACSPPETLGHSRLPTAAPPRCPVVTTTTRSAKSADPQARAFPGQRHLRALASAGSRRSPRLGTCSWPILCRASPSLFLSSAPFLHLLLHQRLVQLPLRLRLRLPLASPHRLAYFQISSIGQR